MRELIEIKNFGPKMVEWLHRIGIMNEKDLLRSDYRTIRDKLQAAGIHPHILIFYSIDMGLQDRKWSDITSEEKLELRRILEMPD
jgi:hypothetical protein